MTIHSLPKELLLSILQKTTEMDQFVCLQVCRTWYQLLLPVVYHTVRIGSIGSFSKFLRTLSRSGPIKRAIRHLELGNAPLVPYRVNDLFFGRVAVAAASSSGRSNDRETNENNALYPSRARLEFLQKNCKNIEFIQYDSALNSVIRPFLAGWTLLRRIPALDSLDMPLLQIVAPRLTTLTLTRRAVIELNARNDTADSCFQPLADLPHLCDLTLSCLVNFGISENNEPLPLDLPRLLRACARLKTLCLSLFNITEPVTQKTGYQQQHRQRQLQTFYPLTTLTLEIVGFGSPQDVIRLSQATPCLTSLSLYRVEVAAASSRIDPEPPSMVWTTFVEQHRHTLRHLAVERIWGPGEWKSAMLAAVRPQSLTMLKTGSLDMTILPTVGSKKTSEQFVDVMLSALSPQATTLETSLWPALLSLDAEFTEPLGRACRFLTDLELTGSTTPVYKEFGKQDVALDALLFQLRHLRRLRLWYVNVVARPSLSTSQLETLCIFESTVCDSLFDYMSLYCLALHSLTMHRCYAYVARPPFTTFAIQMPDTRLQTLSIRNLNFLCTVYDKKTRTHSLRVMMMCSVIAMKHRFGARYYYKDARYGLHMNPDSFPMAVKATEGAVISDTGIVRNISNESKDQAMDEVFFRKLELEWAELERFHMKGGRRGFGILIVNVKKTHQCSFEGHTVPTDLTQNTNTK